MGGGPVIESADDRALAMIAARRRDGARMPHTVLLPSGRVISGPELDTWLSVMDPPAGHHPHPSGSVYVEPEARCDCEPPPPAQPPVLGVAITVSAAVALIATGTVLAFGDGHGWWAAGLIAAGLLLLGRVLDVRGRR